ncbi:MAG: hypothetical protein A4E70_02034 [Syntrophus sp. PtaU1.Bin005]|nr:MAG: hypothetical protein A4E70_02034 [Syntrophus sp. PtaU1.Bin005]
MELIGFVRFAEIIVHSRVHAGPAVAFQGMGRERDNGDPAVPGFSFTKPLPFPDFPGRFIAVHPRHLAVHQDEVVMPGGPGINGSKTVLHHVDVTAEVVQHGRGDRLVDRVVFSQKDAESREDSRVAFSAGGDAIWKGFRQEPGSGDGRNGARFFEARSEAEGGPPPRRTFNLDGPTHHGDELAGNREPQACSPKLAGRGVVLLGEGFENSRLGLRGNPDARVHDLVPHKNRVFVLPLHGHGDKNFPPPRELDRISHEIDEHLPQADRVSPKRRGKPLFHGSNQFQPLSVRRLSEKFDYLPHEGNGVELRIREFHFSGLDLG